MQLSVNQTDLPGNQFRVLMSTLNYCNHRSKVYSPNTVKYQYLLAIIKPA